MQFVDECKLHLRAGNGGNGVISWRREAHYPEGGPWGGDGGNGGDIIAIADHNINTLFDLRNRKNIYAPNGENGQTKMMYGKSGENVYIKLPLGTSIYDAENGELLVDLIESGQTFTICDGGKGGRGNAFFKSSFNRAPTLHENGDLGQERNILLKLKYIADVGLIGLPNAGKSTFVGKISNAKPRVASYQFTTLIPVLGIVNINKDKLVFADIPGLIGGAAKGKGLGHEFLKHIERCHVLIHLISLNGADNENVVAAYKTINSELKQYNKELLNKPIIVVANKIDTSGSRTNLAKLEKHLKHKIFAISALNADGIDKVLQQVHKLFLKAKAENDLKLSSQSQKVKLIELKRQKDHTRELEIVKVDDNVWEIQSDFMKYWTHKIPLDSKDNIIRYNQKMQTIGVEIKAKQLGAVAGDTLLIYGNEFTIDKIVV